MVEPLPPSETNPPRWWRRILLIVAALVAGSLLALIAPPNWAPGPGFVTVDIDGQPVAAQSIEIGSPDEVEIIAGAGTSELFVAFPNGTPLDRPIETRLGVFENGSRIRPDAASVELQLELSDGRRELIPIVGVDDDGNLIGTRRPPRNAGLVLGLLGFVVVMWVSEALPLFVTSLLVPVVLVFGDIAPAGAATEQFFNPIIVLFFAGFLMAEAMKRSGLDHWIAVTITSRSGGSPALLFGSMIGLTAVLSMFMSNTAAAAVLIPIALAVTAPLPGQNYREALVLGIAYAATIGGVGSAIGTPANQLAIEFLAEFGDRSISFVEWFAFGLPMVLLFVPIMGAYLWRRHRIDVDHEAFERASLVADEERRALGRPNRDQMIVLGIFAAVFGGWLTQTFHEFHPGIVALAGAIALFVVGRLEPDDLGRISWPALITFGGGLTLGVFLVETGTSDYVATRLTTLADVPDLLAVGVVALIALILTTVASNTASAAILIPLALPLAGVLDVNPVTLVIVVAIASSVDFALVIGTPPTMMAYATRLYTAGQIFRRGIFLDVVGLFVLVFLVTAFWEGVGLV